MRLRVSELVRRICIGGLAGALLLAIPGIVSADDDIKEATNWLAKAQKNAPAVAAPMSWYDVDVYTRIAALQIELGDLQASRDAVAPLPAGVERDGAYVDAAGYLAVAGDVDNAIALLQQSGLDPTILKLKIVNVFGKVANTGKLDAVERLIDAAPPTPRERAENPIANEGTRDPLLTSLADRYASMGDLDKARAIYAAVQWRPKANSREMPWFMRDPPKPDGISPYPTGQDPAVIAQWWAEYGDTKKATQFVQQIPDIRKDSRAWARSIIALALIGKGENGDASKVLRQAEQDVAITRGGLSDVKDNLLMNLAEAHARLHDRSACIRLLQIFDAKHQGDINERVDGSMYGRRALCFLLIGEVGSAKSIVEHPFKRENEVAPWFRYGQIPYEFALMGHTAALESWINALQGPESPPSAYPLACIGVATGLIEHDSQLKAQKLKKGK